MPAFVGQNTDIDTTAEALGASATISYGIVVKAPASNTGTVYVGLADTVSATTGYPLAPGESESFPVAWCNNVASIYVIASANNQAVAFWGL